MWSYVATSIVWFAAGFWAIALYPDLLSQNAALDDLVKLARRYTQASVVRDSLKAYTDVAEKNWQKTVRDRHELLQQDWPASGKQMPLFPATDDRSYRATPYTIWDLVPASYGCPHEMERVGRMGDGGKWVCGFSRYEALPAEKPCVVYSFGVETESSYEDETIARTNCEIWAYDFSVTDFGHQLTAEHRSKAHFFQAGISGVTDESKSPPFYTIQDLMKKNGHDYIDIIKMDIEFAEFPSLKSLSEAFPSSEGYEFPVGQILVELHLWEREGITSGEFLDWWEMLEERGLRPAWTEPNVLHVALKREDGHARLAEYTLINTRDKRSVLLSS